MIFSVGSTHFEQPRRLPKLCLAMFCYAGLILTTGCFQQRYEPANWESASRPAAKKRPAPPAAAVQTGTTLPGKQSGQPGKQSAATTLPGRKQGGGNSTLPGRSLPAQPKGKDSTQSRPGPNRGNTSLPERPRRGGTTLPERSRNEQAEPARTGRDSNTTLPGREPRRTLDPGRNSGTTLPGRR